MKKKNKKIKITKKKCKIVFFFNILYNKEKTFLQGNFIPKELYNMNCSNL